MSGSTWRLTIRAFWPARCRAAAWQLGIDLHKAFARDLKLDDDYFSAMLDQPMATLRLLHYPTPEKPPAKGQIGAGEHTDYGNVTLLLTDGVAGLEVRTRDNQWIKAPALEHGFICNIGDCLMRWTNDVYVSTPHRVQLPSAERYSIAFFLDPNPTARVEVLETCIDADNPAKYPPVSGAEYLKQRLDASYEFLKEGAP
jgi:isopenicillin N synthase-like dioxygenase